VEQLAAVVSRFGPDALVVSLGVDAAAEDLNSPLEVTQDGFAAAGRLLGQLARPTVLVHEGGYVLDTLAGHTLAVLQGVEAGTRPAGAG
jgi:acetoin utilization deacetylase AcuC-like enzyme